MQASHCHAGFAGFAGFADFAGSTLVFAGFKLFFAGFALASHWFCKLRRFRKLRRLHTGFCRHRTGFAGFAGFAGYAYFVV